MNQEEYHEIELTQNLSLISLFKSSGNLRPNNSLADGKFEHQLPPRHQSRESVPEPVNREPDKKTDDQDETIYRDNFCEVLFGPSLLQSGFSNLLNQFDEINF